MRGPKQRILDALIALGIGLVFIVLFSFVGYYRGHGDAESAGAAAAGPMIATVVTAIVAASMRRRLRPVEMAVLIFVISAFLYARH